MPTAVAPVVSPYFDAAVTLAPCSRAVPIGAEVVLVAGVRGGDNYLRTNRRLDWSLAPGSVGQFTEIGEGHLEDFLVGDFSRPRIVSNTSAIGTTTRVAEQVGQGGRIYVARGEGWIALRSAVEGVSCVTVAAPSVVVPTERAKMATIYWYDAQYSLPEPVITPPGTKGSLTTSVWKLTSHCPLPGWIVRYELTGGPQAIVVPSGTTAVEVPTDAAGHASVEIVQKDPSPGTSQIRVQLFHPADQCGPRFLVRDGCTAVSWMVGAAAAPTRPAPTLPGPASTTPPTTVRPPIVTPPPSGGIPSVPNTRPSTQPRPAPAPVSILEVKVTPQTEAVVGSNVTFDIDVANRGTTTARSVSIRDTYEPGLEHPVPSPLGFSMGDLAPRESRRHAVTLRITKPGKLCHRVEALAADGGHAAIDSCIVAAAAAEAPAPIIHTPPPAKPNVIAPPTLPSTIPPNPNPAAGTGPVPRPAPPSRLVVNVDNRNTVIAGKNQHFVVAVTNEGDASENDIVVMAQLPVGSTLVREETGGPDRNIKFEEQQGKVLFDPVPLLRPNTVMTYRISVTTVRPGPISLQAQATSRRQTQPVGGSKSVDVLEP